MDSVLKKMDLEFLGSGKHKISLDKFIESKDSVFLDVRDRREVGALSINLDIFGIETVIIPIDELPDRLDELPKNREIFCFCSSGTRSAWAYIYLLSKGYKTRWLDASNEDFATILKPGKILKVVK